MKSIQCQPLSISMSSPSVLFEACAVCGGPPSSRRFGALACFRCNVFFRNMLLNKRNIRCSKNPECEIGIKTRYACQGCRFKKCLKSGMDPKALKHRDKIGPRSPKMKSNKPQFQSAEIDFRCLLDLQKSQKSKHQYYNKPNQYRLAKPSDINLMLRIGFMNATEWGNCFRPFRYSNRSVKKRILSEFGIASGLIDQAFKTATETNQNEWLFINNSCLRPDAFCTVHNDFLNTLKRELSQPFRILQLDSFECVILKTLMLLTPSFPEQSKLQSTQKSRDKCTSELMKCCLAKFPLSGVERFGEIILLIGSIRTTVKEFHNHTKRSDLYNPNHFDIFVTSFMLA
ncbi:Nuclear Hormone Receptor family [Caenorhabditis elegans]|uniref:Nuclear Hormone Receptor family n=1 Tax=Caenorhabditis elegans TaxID=6239 RepID=O46003_CAEEL|nr:Nuclear Hormone Receptor family [Caenorhabditis elegans]CAB04989.1 Nuclear Hormone Receptor family [Caenorhabditis elegans]|eukprot:NP_507334.1 Nuclear Hormone Receptor family [Caenorhabditis elegans]